MANCAAGVELVVVAGEMVGQAVLLAHAQLNPSRNLLLAGTTLHAGSMPGATHDRHSHATKAQQCQRATTASTHAWLVCACA